MLSLREANIFRLKPLIINFHSKLSAISENDSNKQILCLVSDDNEILLRYVNEIGSDALKLICWFKRSGRVIHDICFDNTGSWLLVLCFDNTLHIVPALKTVDETQIVSNGFSSTEITSFVIPFIGPHECPNSKTCPNNDSTTTTMSSSPIRLVDYVFDKSNQKDVNNEFGPSTRIAVPMTCDVIDAENIPYAALETFGRASSVDTSSSRHNAKCSKETEVASVTNQTNSTNNESAESFMSSSTCPFPICATWWQTIDKRNRAVIGYSDGSICFVALTPNCPFISNTCIESGGVVKLLICRDNSLENVTLLINSSTKEQWKLLLEQKSIGYTFPGDASPNSSQQSDLGREDWQIVTPLKSNSSDRQIDCQVEDDIFGKMEETKESGTSSSSPMHPSTSQKSQDSDEVPPNVKSGILPAAKARLASLKDLGAKKFVALKMKLSDNKCKVDQYVSEDSLNTFAIMESPVMTPEILTTPVGPYFIVQNLRNTFLLSALHTYSDTLSVHSMDISLIPLYLYKIPKNCHDVLISSNILYAVQMVDSHNRKSQKESAVSENEITEENFEKEEVDTNEKKMNYSIAVISSAMASMSNGEEISFNEKALLAQFDFNDEAVINIHRMGTFPIKEPASKPTLPKEESNDTLQLGDIRSPSSYVRLHRKLEKNDQCSSKDVQIMQNEFPKINFDPCIVVTNKNTYFIEFNNDPNAIFLNAAIAGMWNTCKEFCNTFDLSFTRCIEFAGDCLLRKKKVAQALLTYNVVRIKPVTTALKLAMFGENYALMHLCAMALKSIFILKSRFPAHPTIKYLLEDHQKRHAEDIKPAVLKRMSIDRDELVNEGKSCSDFTYCPEEPNNEHPMSASSQFHLSNLLLLTLTERAVKEKNYMPVWNFIITNTKFHLNMTSIVLCQSGLYSSALLLAMVRGACFDVFIGFVNVANHEFGWYSEINVLLYNLSERIFTECITYLRYLSVDYFTILQSKLYKLEESVLKRLERQLNPFSAVFRPIVSQLSAKNSVASDPNSKELLEFCKFLIETYLGVVMQIEALKSTPDNILNALTSFRINYEDNQFAIKSSNFSPLSAGCSHCACVVDGCAYLWGSSGIACIYSIAKASDPPEPAHVIKSLDLLAQLNLEVHAVKCGREHTLVLTNNGIYAFGINHLGQLGIGKHMSAALQPMLVEALDRKNITILEAGQYHNAAVADGKLYTWGWGVYGQLGHGNVENAYTPKPVKFFTERKVIQVSLAHAHSLVLCKGSSGMTELFVFGSNHFGQLGVGQSVTANDGTTSSLLKSLVPIKLDFSNVNLRLIHTKFFTNIAVTENNEMFTWGSSPQALRLANQIRRRANAKQKLEDSLKKEIIKRIEMNEEMLKQGTKDIVLGTSSSSSSQKLPSTSTSASSSLPVCSSTEVSVQKRIHKSSSSSRLSEEFMCDTISDGLKRNSSPTRLNKSEDNVSCDNQRMTEKSMEIEMKIITPRLLLSDNKKAETNGSTSENLVGSGRERLDNKSEPESKTINKKSSIEEDCGDHLYPQLVDTSEVSGQILQVSSGLFHFSLVSSTSVLYTWGKNLEHQLGTEDKDRKTVSRPTALESIENPLFVECGADFTLVMTTDFVVKAFGGNANGQCGREIDSSMEKGKLPGKLFCLPTTKRLMRLDGQCIESPVEINLPRPSINMDTKPTRYLKSFPKFTPKFVSNSVLQHRLESNKIYSDGNLHENCYLESDDIGSSIENMSINDDESLCSAGFRARNLSSNDISPDEEYDGRIPISTTQSIVDGDLYQSRAFRHYIHYCLYIFHGLYDPIRVNEFSYNSIEFRIRTLMLNYKYIEAFTLCLSESQNAQKSIKIFEYFTKDPSIVPMRRKDLKFFIYQLFIHFISKKLDLTECERFFLSDLDYYLLELSYVMYFNNNNTELEQSLNRKFKDLFAQDLSENQDHKLENTDLIFDNLTVKFKAIVCKRLITVYDQ